MCYCPVLVKRDELVSSFPCGKCEKCLKRRVSGWSFRLMQQDRISMSAYFLTLTYAVESVPITKNGFMGLDKRDLQLFFKRLRKAHGGICSDGNTTGSITGSTIKYYAVGEYGGTSYRPHYHIIIFNADLELMIGKELAFQVKNQVIPLDGKYPFQCIQWPAGHVTIGEVNAASVGYTLKYVSKPKRIPMHRNDDRLPEFALMSKRMGKNYITDQIMAWHKADLLNRMHLTTEQGQKIAMPRYYKDLLYNRMERSEIAGYQKGEIEKRLMQETEDHQNDIKTLLHNKREAVKASYSRMYKNAENGRDKI